jgi:DNA-binding NarL/FixJ family response regulator
MIGPSVMFVDDEPQALAALVRVFRDDPDLNIFVALDGLDALRKLERNRIDLLVTDFRMPGMNGAELLDEVSRLYPRTKGAILSAYPELATGLRGLDGRQCRPFFYKPWDNKTFHQAIRRLLLLPPNTPLLKVLSGSRN